MKLRPDILKRLWSVELTTTQLHEYLRDHPDAWIAFVCQVDPSGKFWLPVLCKSRSEPVPIKNARGAQRILRSLKVIENFYRDYYPDAQSVEIPIEPETLAPADHPGMCR